MTKKKRELTELQERFLDIFLEEEYQGNLRKAMKAAGYNDTTSIASVVNSLRDEIVERAKNHLAAHSAKAVLSLIGVLDDPNAMGTSNKIKAANSILERSGIKEKEESKVNIPASGGLIILPAKGNHFIADDTEEDS